MPTVWFVPDIPQIPQHRGHLTKQEIESVYFQHADLAQMMKKHDPKKLKDGVNTVADQTIFYISNPGLGLWATKARFKYSLVGIAHSQNVPLLDAV